MIIQALQRTAATALVCQGVRFQRLPRPLSLSVRPGREKPLSYYTRVTFEFSDEPPEVDAVSAVARLWLVAQNLYAVDDVLADFNRGWTEGQTEFKGLVSQDVEGLMTYVSAQFPEIGLFVRGMGEEFKDVWLRHFEGGKIVFTLGPFEQSDM